MLLAAMKPTAERASTSIIDTAMSAGGVATRAKPMLIHWSSTSMRCHARLRGSLRLSGAEALWAPRASRTSGLVWPCGPNRRRSKRRPTPRPPLPCRKLLPACSGYSWLCDLSVCQVPAAQYHKKCNQGSGPFSQRNLGYTSARPALGQTRRTTHETQSEYCW